MSILFRSFFYLLIFFLTCWESSSGATLSNTNQRATFNTRTNANETPSSKTGMAWEEREERLNRIQRWRVKGKVAVQTSKNSGSATVDWWQRRGYYSVVLYGPIGTGTMRLQGGPGQVVLQTANGNTTRARSAEELLARQWGFKLPVSHLNYWIRGLPVPGMGYKPRFDAKNRIVQLYQGGWVIRIPSYTRTSRGIDLPTRLSISSPYLRSKLIIYNWSVS